MDANPNTLLGWDESGSEKRYLDEGNRKEGRELELLMVVHS